MQLAECAGVFPISSSRSVAKRHQLRILLIHPGEAEHGVRGCSKSQIFFSERSIDVDYNVTVLDKIGFSSERSLWRTLAKDQDLEPLNAMKEEERTAHFCMLHAHNLDVLAHG